MVATLTLIAAGGAVGLAGASFASGWYFSDGEENEAELEAVEALDDAPGVRMKSATRAPKPGILSSYKREKKKRKALGEGVVRWHLVGSSFEAPMYVKPQRKEGGSVPELEYEGETYVFPETATVPSEEEGVPTVIHRRGEAEPLNLRDEWEHSVDAKSLSEYLTLRVTSRAPEKSLLDGLGLGDYDSMTLLRYGILGIVGLAIIWELLGGGL